MKTFIAKIHSRTNKEPAVDAARVPRRFVRQVPRQTWFWCGWKRHASLGGEHGPLSLCHIVQFPDTRLGSRPVLLSWWALMQEDHSAAAVSVRNNKKVSSEQCYLHIHCIVRSQHLELQEDDKISRKTVDSRKPRGSAWLTHFPFSHFCFQLRNWSSLMKMQVFAYIGMIFKWFCSYSVDTSVGKVQTLSCLLLSMSLQAKPLFSSPLLTSFEIFLNCHL